MAGKSRIRKKYEEIIDQQDLLHNQLIALQNSCQHLKVEKEFHSDTGNYCKQDDCYWVECKCPECGKFWTEVQ